MNVWEVAAALSLACRRVWYVCGYGEDEDGGKEGADDVSCCSNRCSSCNARASRFRSPIKVCIHTYVHSIIHSFIQKIHTYINTSIHMYKHITYTHTYCTTRDKYDIHTCKHIRFKAYIHFYNELFTSTVSFRVSLSCSTWETPSSTAALVRTSSLIVSLSPCIYVCMYVSFYVCIHWMHEISFAGTVPQF